jgi:hypothetical protein
MCPATKFSGMAPGSYTGAAVFVADDLEAWLVGLVADAGRKKLTEIVLGSDQDRALRRSATAAVDALAAELCAGDAKAAEQLALVVSHVFGEPIPGEPLVRQPTVWRLLQERVAQQLAVSDDRAVTGIWQFSANLLDVPATVLADQLTAHLLSQAIARAGLVADR